MKINPRRLRKNTIIIKFDKIKNFRSFRRSPYIPWLKRSIFPSFLFGFYYFDLWTKTKTSLDSGFKHVVANYVCTSGMIQRFLAREIMLLVRREKTKEFLARQFVRLFYNEGFINDVDRLTLRLLIYYLHSNDCDNDVTNLIIKDVLGNPAVRNELFYLVKELVLVSNCDQLEDQLEDQLVATLKNEKVRMYFADAASKEAVNKLNSEEFLNNTKKNIIKTFI